MTYDPVPALGKKRTSVIVLGLGKRPMEVLDALVDSGEYPDRSTVVNHALDEFARHLPTEAESTPDRPEQDEKKLAVDYLLSEGAHVHGDYLDALMHLHEKGVDYENSVIHGFIRLSPYDWSMAYAGEVAVAGEGMRYRYRIEGEAFGTLIGALTHSSLSYYLRTRSTVPWIEQLYVTGMVDRPTRGIVPNHP